MSIGKRYFIQFIRQRYRRLYARCNGEHTGLNVIDLTKHLCGQGIAIRRGFNNDICKIQILHML